MRLLLITVLALFLNGSLQTNPERPEPVSMITLIANPEKYDGKQVSVVGFLRFGFESDTLYLSKEDGTNLVVKNGLYVELTKDMVRRLESLDEKYVIVAGIFSATKKGHMSAASGGLIQISRCDPWFSEKELQHLRNRKKN